MKQMAFHVSEHYGLTCGSSEFAFHPCQCLCNCLQDHRAWLYSCPNRYQLSQLKVLSFWGHWLRERYNLHNSRYSILSSLCPVLRDQTLRERQETDGPSVSYTVQLSPCLTPIYTSQRFCTLEGGMFRVAILLLNKTWVLFLAFSKANLLTSSGGEGQCSVYFKTKHRV